LHRQQELSKLKLNFALINGDTACGISLWISVNKQCFLSHFPRQAARLTEVVVFPTPPFWFDIAIIFAKKSPCLLFL